MNVLATISKLQEFNKKEDYQGWDPYDGLNSRVFNATPLKHWDLARLAWIQAFKRNPVNLRKLVMVPKAHNPKGIALFLTGYCNIYHTQLKTGVDDLGKLDEILVIINELAELLISLKTDGFSGACWGYNFDWQARRLFLFPAGTPTVVATSFAANALFLAYEITRNRKYLDLAVSSGKFVLNDLNRTRKEKGFLFSYSPYKGNDTVYNASLLGSRLVSQCYHYTGDVRYKEIAGESVIASVNAQKEDGSWAYGELPIQNWIDSFHTGYNLECLHSYQDLTGDKQVGKAINQGLEFYLSNFFLKDGTPKYYHNKTYPIDIHSPAQLLVTISILGKLKENRDLVDRVLSWTIKNMQDKKGYFYYQKHKLYTNKIPYMRWSEAFMFYGLSFYLLEANLTRKSNG